MNLSQAIAEYGAIIFGLVIGTLAHFGRLLSSGDLPSPAQAIGYLMQLGFIGLVAVAATRLLNITDDDMRALATAILAISAQEVIRYLRSNGWRPFVSSVSGGTIEGERREAEQKARAAHYIVDNDLTEEALERIRKERGE